jgi:pseudoazurin
MKNTSRNFLLLVLTVLANTGYAANHKVQMLNSGVEGYMVFEPASLTVDPGDSVTFVATDLSHNSASIEGMIPEGAVPWSGKMSEDVTVTFDKTGIYVYQCTPHAMMAMVGVINVGDTKENLTSIKAAALVKKTSFVTNKERLDNYLLSL